MSYANDLNGGRVKIMICSRAQLLIVSRRVEKMIMDVLGREWKLVLRWSANEAAKNT